MLRIIKRIGQVNIATIPSVLFLAFRDYAQIIEV
jgi:hypothetical protein